MVDIWKDEDANDLLPQNLVSKEDNCREPISITEADIKDAISYLPNLSTIVKVKGMLKKWF